MFDIIVCVRSVLGTLSNVRDNNTIAESGLALWLENRGRRRSTSFMEWTLVSLPRLFNNMFHNQYYRIKDIRIYRGVPPASNSFFVPLLLKVDLFVPVEQQADGKCGKLCDWRLGFTRIEISSWFHYGLDRIQSNRRNLRFHHLELARIQPD